MTEWILIITMHLMSPSLAMPDISTETIDGFKSKELCQSAGAKISHQLIIQVGAHREQHKIESNTKNYAPSINAECIAIRK